MDATSNQSVDAVTEPAISMKWMAMTPAAQRSLAPVSVLRVTRRSTVDLVVTELRNAIFSGALTVGNPIAEMEMARQLGVSRSPLREATQRLVQEGILTARPGRGVSVSVIGADEVADLYQARMAVESQALLLIVSDHRSALRAVEDAYDRLVNASAGSDARAIGDADIGFHHDLVTAAGSHRLCLYMATLALETRIASFSCAQGYTVRRNMSATYEQLMTALRQADLSAARAALERQFDDAVARLTGADETVETVETDPASQPPAVEPISTP